MRDGRRGRLPGRLPRPAAGAGSPTSSSGRPDGAYEAADTKLARHAKPSYVLQLCFYSEQVGRIQGRLPERMHVVLGTGERETFRARRLRAPTTGASARASSTPFAHARPRRTRSRRALRDLRLPRALRGAVGRATTT